MLIRDTLITILDGKTITSHAPGTLMLTGGSESTLFAGINSPEVLLFLIFPLKRINVDTGASVLSPLPLMEAGHRKIPTTSQKGAGYKRARG